MIVKIALLEDEEEECVLTESMLGRFFSAAGIDYEIVHFRMPKVFCRTAARLPIFICC